MKKRILLYLLCASSCLCAADFETVSFEAKDKLLVTADVYMAHSKEAPFIILFHQAEFSRGEYRPIAPTLTDMGFNCMAVDQRSGSAVNRVDNLTASRARKQKRPSTYLDTLPDLEAAVAFARKNYIEGPLILWGSSYSAALVLKLAGDMREGVDGVLAFSPGEYFRRRKGGTFITDSARHISAPVFITSARDEKRQWWPIFEAIASPQKSYFLPETSGIHGSRALWTTTKEHEEYWEAVEKFLARFVPSEWTDRFPDGKFQGEVPDSAPSL